MKVQITQVASRTRTLPQTVLAEFSQIDDLSPMPILSGDGVVLFANVIDRITKRHRHLMVPQQSYRRYSTGLRLSIKADHIKAVLSTPEGLLAQGIFASGFIWGENTELEIILVSQRHDTAYLQGTDPVAIFHFVDTLEPHVTPLAKT